LITSCCSTLCSKSFLKVPISHSTRTTATNIARQ
jgi:hypothetical protein